jgi:hypothetical protein
MEMDLEKLATNFGFPGLLIAVIGYISVTLGRLWIASNERIQLEHVKVEDKRADANVAALTLLGGKIDAHQIADIKSHQEMAVGIADLSSKVDALGWGGSTPIEGVPRQEMRDVKSGPVRNDAGVYGLSRGKTRG